MVWRIPAFALEPNSSRSPAHRRCTDIGTRTIIAIKIENEPDWYYEGPPYGVVETVFDEFDIDGCSPAGEAASAG